MFAALALVWCSTPAALLITSGNSRGAVVSLGGMFGGVKHPHPPAERRALSPNSLQKACPKNDKDSGKRARIGRETTGLLWWCLPAPPPLEPLGIVLVYY